MAVGNHYLSLSRRSHSLFLSLPGSVLVVVTSKRPVVDCLLQLFGGEFELLSRLKYVVCFFSHDSAPAHQLTLPTGLSFNWSETCPEIRQPMQPYGDWRANSEIDRQPMQPLAKHALALSACPTTNLSATYLTNLRSTTILRAH